jgi:murein L,D-transpeptidase YcbB/YkuD
MIRLRKWLHAVITGLSRGTARQTLPLVITMATAAGAILPVPAWPSAKTTADAVREALRTRFECAGLPTGLTVGDEPIHASETAARFFEARSFYPAWSIGQRMAPAGQDLMTAIELASAHGLASSHYHQKILQDRLQRLESSRAAETGPIVGPVVDIELLLTDAYLLLGSHLHSGRVNPESVDPEWFAARRGKDMALVLENAIITGRIVESLAALAPRQFAYERLLSTLERYRKMAPWQPLIDGPPLRINDRGPRVADLRSRLVASGDLPSVSPDPKDHELLDEELQGAVKRYQARHGLDVDGVVGKDTLIELNRPLMDRIGQILVNLERWRWMPESLGKRHVLVNIAGFEAAAVADGVRTLEMRAIVGRAYRRTPVFSDRITYMVLNPSWAVPTSIAVQDKLPLIRKDPNYLSQQNMRVFSGWGADAREIDPATVDWSAVSARGFPFRLLQEPGPLNALGTMKFMFPNRFNVYLHDTSAPELFDRSTRDFSSGCIRVEKPKELALFLLEPEGTWNEQRLSAELATKAEKTVALAEPVPVHIQYWTAWVTDDGTVHFRKDVYGRDSRVATALLEPPPDLQEHGP